MKKSKLLNISVSLLSLILLISLTFTFYSPSSKVYALEDGDFNSSPSPVIGELFTGAWCGFCPFANSALGFVQLTRFSREEFFYLAYHYNDPMATSESTERTNFYKVNSYPSIIIDGTNKIVNDSTDPFALAQGYITVIDEVIKKKNYIAEIALGGSFESNEFNIKILANEDFGKRNINIVAVIYEDYVNFEGSNGDCFHRYVVRNMPYGSKGRGLTKLKKDQVFEDTRKFVLSTKAKELVGLVVFLQDIDTKEIVGSGIYRFASKEDTIFYWNDKPATGAINLKTCKNDLSFNANKAVDLKEVFLQIKLNNEYFEIVGAKLPEGMSEEDATLTIDPTRGEVKCTYKKPISGNAELFSVTVKFKKKIDKLDFPLKKFVVLDASGNQIPFVLYDIRYICYIAVKENEYDLDNNLSVNKADLIILENCFGAFRKDKDFNRSCDFNKDSRIDIEDLTELIFNLE